MEAVSKRVDDILTVSLTGRLNALFYLCPANVKSKTLLYNRGYLQKYNLNCCDIVREIMKMNVKTILLLIICGIVISLLSAVYSTDMTVGLGASITGYGLPLLWLKKVTVIVPGTPDTYSLYGSGLYLLADIVFWTIIAAIIYLIYKQATK